MSRVESSVHLIYHDLSDLGSLILIQIVSKSPLLIIYMPREISKHRTGQPINQWVWKPETHTHSYSLFVVFNHKGIPCAWPYCWGVYLVNPGYPNKLVLKLTVSLLLLWLWSLYDHSPVFIWFWLSLSLLLKSLEEHSLQLSTHSRFISGIKRRLIYGGCCFFNLSTLFDMTHWFEFKYWLLYMYLLS